MDTDTIIEEISEGNYISSDKNGQIMIHRTLRDIAAAYNISHSTISKAFLSSKIENVCSCKSRIFGEIVIRKLCST